MELNGAAALVTAGHVRIGRQIARTLARKGCHIALQYNRAKQEALETVTELRGLGIKAEALQAELTDSDQIQAMVNDAIGQLGGIDILVNNASAFFRTPFAEIREEDWDTLHEVNLKAPFLTAWHLAPHMQSRGHGKIINIADWAGRRPYRHYLPYCVSKGGLITLTQALAKELAPTIQVNCICPGPILWPDDMPEDTKQTILDKTPLARAGDPQDIANMVLFLAEGTDFATGGVFTIDGGRAIH